MATVTQRLRDMAFVMGAVGLVGCSSSSDSSPPDATSTGGTVNDQTTGGGPAAGGSAGQQTTGGSPAIGGSAGEETTGGSPAVGGSAGEETTGGGGGLEPAEEARSQTPYDTTPAVPAADYEAFISNTNDFGLDVFEQLAAEDTNVVFSPVSTAFALAMTYAGARGETATQMAAVLHNDLPDTTFHAALNQLSLDLASRNVAPHETIDGTKSVRLSLVNAAWAQQDYAILPDFLDILSANYDAGVRLLDYIGDPDGSRQIINRWVADETEDKIQDLIPPDGITTDTRLVLSNALYFYATWQAPFLLEATSAGTFSTLSGQDVATEMMHDTSYYRYAEGSGYQLLDLPYDGDELCMTIVLPEAGRFSEIRDALSDTWLTGVRAAATTDREIQVSVPKFGFTWGTTSLTPALRALGMTDAFEYPIADFSGIEPTRELYVSDVFHQAFVAIDEHGTEAAAATAVVLTAGAIPDPPVPFTVDRPFIFFIHDSTDVILFAGQVVDPSS